MDHHSESQQPLQRLVKKLCSGSCVPFAGIGLFRFVPFFKSCRVLGLSVEWAVLSGRHCTENKVRIVLPSGT